MSRLPPDFAWRDAILAARVLGAAGGGLGGAILLAPPGPARDAWLDALKDALPVGAPWRRLPSHATASQLLGGVDLAATIAAGRQVREAGLIARAIGGALVVPMAERLAPGIAALLGQALDEDKPPVLVLLDESEPGEAGPAAALRERLAFHIDLTGIRPADEPGITGGENASGNASELGGEVIEAFCAASLACGIASARAPLLALRAARALSETLGEAAIGDEAASWAARMVLAPRATRVPPEESEAQAGESDTPPPEEATPPDDEGRAHEEETLSERVIEAVRTALPAALLAGLLAGAGRPRTGGASGAALRSRLRGRPAGVLAGDPRGGNRLALIDTLRAAAPWQRLRGRDGQVRVRREDFRIRRFLDRARNVTIFVVDASGSAALARLGEAKGAVETLLADCYVRRDQAALIAFRGTTADILLPPTSALARAKRSLAALPGGGGTPLASGLDAACLLAAQLRRRGDTPVLVLLTDGRANIARDGTAGRGRAFEDALAAAGAVRAEGVAALVIDTSAKPREEGQVLARRMGARYLPLPAGDPAMLASAVTAILPAPP